MSQDRLLRIEEKIDKLVERLGSIDVTLAKQHDQLEYHIKRTDLLESELKPVRDHVRFLKTAMKWIAVCGTIAGIVKLFL